MNREPLLWRLLARIAASKPVARWLIARSQLNPYKHLPEYMERGWIFNPYPGGSGEDAYRSRWPWLPSIRVHHILAPDWGSDPHNHPWNARTIILKGFYCEKRLWRREACMLWGRGDTYALTEVDFHHIYAVGPGGCWTLFITFPKPHGRWGFLVQGDEDEQLLIDHTRYQGRGPRPESKSGK